MNSVDIIGLGEVLVIEYVAKLYFKENQTENEIVETIKNIYGVELTTEFVIELLRYV